MMRVWSEEGFGVSGDRRQEATQYCHLDTLIKTIIPLPPKGIAQLIFEFCDKFVIIKFIPVQLVYSYRERGVDLILSQAGPSPPEIQCTARESFSEAAPGA